MFLTSFQILDALIVPSNITGSGVFKEFNPDDPWHQMARRFFIAEFDADKSLLMNFIDYEGDPRRKHGVNIHYHQSSRTR